MPCNGNNSTHLQLHMYIVFYDPSTILGHWYWWCFDSAHDFSSIQKYSTSFNFSKTGTSSSVKHLLPLQQCQGWARSPTPVYRGLNKFPSSQWTHVNTIETAARPEWQKVPWTNMFAAKSSLLPEVHPVQPIYTYIYIYRSISTSRSKGIEQESKTEFINTGSFIFYPCRFHVFLLCVLMPLRCWKSWEVDYPKECTLEWSARFGGCPLLLRPQTPAGKKHICRLLYT